MDRRKVLLLVAGVVAALGTLLVFVYVHGADNRADQRYSAVTVLRVVKQINPGEKAEEAQAAGKIESASVAKQDVLAGAVNGLDPIAGKSASTVLYPGEQITTNKFGSAGVDSGLTIPKGKIAVSVSLNDPQRVAGFVSPGDKVAVFCTCDTGTRLLLPNAEAIAVGTTTMTPTTVTDQSTGAQSTESLPKTLLTLGLSQTDSEKVIWASNHGGLYFGLLNNDSEVAASPGINNGNLFG